MTGVKSFTELLIWQRARAWSKSIFHLTRGDPFCKDRRLVVQINDSSESVMANIAEGFGRGTQGEFVMFLGYAIGSLDETRSHLSAAYDREYLSRDQYAEIFSEGTEIRKMTVALIQSMGMPRSGVKYLRKTPDWSERVWETYERLTGNSRPELFQRAKEEKQQRAQEAEQARRARKKR